MTMELDKLFEKLGKNKMATTEPAEVCESDWKNCQKFIIINASLISKSGFHLSIESNLLWFCSTITILSNQFKTLATLTSIHK